MLFFLDPATHFSASYGDLLTDLAAPVNDVSSPVANQVSLANQSATTAHSSYRYMVPLLRSILQHQPQIDLRLIAAPVSPGQADLGTPSGSSRSASQLTSHLAPSSQQTQQPLADLANWRRRLLNSPSRILLETSGSTGQPKTVWHTLASLTRGVRLGDEQRGAIWGLAYPLDHLAGLQVLFQAVLNFNPLIQLYRLDSTTIHQAIDRQEITHLSCTPTFLRMLLAADAVHPSLRRLTNGGERYDRELDRRIGKMFPNAQRRNIYASTEVGPLLVSNDDQFRIPDPLRPSIRIVDGELWLHHGLRVDLESDEANRSIPGSEHEAAPAEHFFPTGDQVEVLAESPLTIRFLSRKTEGFNVAGFRIDPHRLESIARRYPGIANARFYGIPNSVTEHVVACELLLEASQEIHGIHRQTGQEGHWDTDQFRSWFAQQVQRHEIPRMINIVSELKLTESGKVDRL